MASSTHRTIFFIAAGLCGLGVLLLGWERSDRSQKSVANAHHSDKRVTSVIAQERIPSLRSRRDASALNDTRDDRRASTHKSSYSKRTVAPLPTATPEPGDPYIGESLLGVEPGFDAAVAFDQAGGEFAVPPDLLKAIAFVESGVDHKSGAVGPRGGRGVMGLRDGGPADTLTEAAQALGVEKSVLVRDPAQNVRGAAALLRKYYEDAGGSADGAAQWEIAISHYSGLPPNQAVTYAQDIRNVLQEGLEHRTSDSEMVIIEAGQTLPED